MRQTPIQQKLLKAYFQNMPDKCMGAAVAYTTLTPLFNHPQAALLSEVQATDDHSPPHGMSGGGGWGSRPGSPWTSDDDGQWGIPLPEKPTKGRGGGGAGELYFISLFVFTM